MVQQYVCGDGARSSFSAFNTVSFTTTSLSQRSTEWTAASGLLDQIVLEPVAGQNLLRADPTLASTPSARLTLARFNDDVAGCVVSWIDPAGTHGWLGSLAVLPCFSRPWLCRSSGADCRRRPATR
jgi:hypothetical protein